MLSPDKLFEAIPERRITAHGGAYNPMMPIARRPLQRQPYLAGGTDYTAVNNRSTAAMSSS